MANIKSQKKRIITAEKARMRNKAVRSELKTAVKRVRAAVEAKVIKTGKGKKLNIITYRPKKGSMVRKGHRQPYTKVEITAIKG